MKDKCEWKDGEFEGCSIYNVTYEMFIHPTSEVRGWSRHKKRFDDTYSNFSFCPFCGGDIRKPIEATHPTHEEIWNKAWKISECGWSRVIDYDAKMGMYSICREWQTVAYFIGRESADIPPEEK